jgi:hypothetical protein
MLAYEPLDDPPDLGIAAPRCNRRWIPFQWSDSNIRISVPAANGWRMSNPPPVTMLEEHQQNASSRSSEGDLSLLKEPRSIRARSAGVDIDFVSDALRSLDGA